jgi:hypothetical protein
MLFSPSHAKRETSSEWGKGGPSYNEGRAAIAKKGRDATAAPQEAREGGADGNGSLYNILTRK